MLKYAFNRVSGIVAYPRAPFFAFCSEEHIAGEYTLKVYIFKYRFAKIIKIATLPR